MKDHSGHKNICLNGTLYLLVDIENISEFSDTYSLFFLYMKESNALKEQWLFLKYISWLQLTNFEKHKGFRLYAPSHLEISVP